MSAITAKEVKALRDRTGAAMMACKNALTEAAGDIDRALAVSEDEVLAEDLARETRIAAEQAAERPANVRDRIIEGKVDKWLDEVVLLRQKHVNEDKYEGKTIEELRAKLAADTGENVVIRRFARFSVGG